jgi:hypothetical protein
MFSHLQSQQEPEGEQPLNQSRTLTRTESFSLHHFDGIMPPMMILRYNHKWRQEFGFARSTTN